MRACPKVCGRICVGRRESPAHRARRDSPGLREIQAPLVKRGQQDCRDLRASQARRGRKDHEDSLARKAHQGQKGHGAREAHGGCRVLLDQRATKAKKAPSVLWVHQGREA